MSTGTPALGHALSQGQLVDYREQADQVEVQIDQEEPDRDSFFWRQINEVLTRSYIRSTSGWPEGISKRKLPGSPGPPQVLVAPGILVRSNEYEQRYGGIGLEQLREQLSPELFKVFVRHIGSIPGDSNLDINFIATVPE